MNNKYVKTIFIGSVLGVFAACLFSCVLWLIQSSVLLKEVSTALKPVPIEYVVMFSIYDDIVDKIDNVQTPITIEPGDVCHFDGKLMFNIRTADNKIYSILYNKKVETFDISYLYKDEPYWFEQEHLKILSMVKEQDDSVVDFTYQLQTFKSDTDVESLTIETDNGSVYTCKYDKDMDTIDIKLISE